MSPFGAPGDMLGCRIVETELAFLCQLMMTAAVIVLVLEAILK